MILYATTIKVQVKSNKLRKKETKKNNGKKYLRQDVDNFPKWVSVATQKRDKIKSRKKNNIENCQHDFLFAKSILEFNCNWLHWNLLRYAVVEVCLFVGISFILTLFHKGNAVALPYTINSINNEAKKRQNAKKEKESKVHADVVKRIFV